VALSLSLSLFVFILLLIKNTPKKMVELAGLGLSVGNWPEWGLSVGNWPEWANAVFQWKTGLAPERLWS
jgi:hypothetical protein